MRTRIDPRAFVCLAAGEGFCCERTLTNGLSLANRIAHRHEELAVRFLQVADKAGNIVKKVEGMKLFEWIGFDLHAIKTGS